MSIANTIKKIAAYLLILIDPGNALLVNNDSEQGMPFWIALLILVISVLIMALLLFAAYEWIVSSHL